MQFERYGAIGKLVLKNLRRFWKDKKKDEDLFDRLTPSRLNEQFNALMPGLSAKVFRTYNASITLERELEDLPVETPDAEKVLEYNRANREVAILCNHQRTVPKAFEKTWEKLILKEALMVTQLDELRAMRPRVAKGTPVRLKSEAAAKRAAAGVEGEEVEPDDAEEVAQAKRLAEEEAHLFAKQPSTDELDRRIASWEDKLEKLRLDMRNKDENKTVALGTSKINYMDPRVRAPPHARRATRFGFAHPPRRTVCMPAFPHARRLRSHTASASSCPLSACSRARFVTSSRGLWASNPPSGSEVGRVRKLERGNARARGEPL